MEDKKNRDTTSRSWLLTLPAEVYTKDYVIEQLGMYAFVAGQLEKGNDTDYIHWQLMVEHSGPIRFSTLRNKFPKGHFDMRRGTAQQVYDYVTKSDTSLGETIEIGEYDFTSYQGKRNDLWRYRDLIMEGWTPDEIIIAPENPSAYIHRNHLIALYEVFKKDMYSKVERDIEVNYLYGPTGVGKTRHIYDNCNDFYRVTAYKNPFDDYEAQTTLVLDEFAGQMELDLVLNVLDRYPLRLPCRYRDKWACYEKVWIVSNLAPDEVYDVWIESERLKAFRRRLHNVYCMVAPGELVAE
uniref:Replication-associated protein n=1 Tax=Pygoscelis antarcticus TaxID=79643 RepID=A0A7G7LKJ5_PYGAN|nr:replication-associated protein [Pygoscelis antarcticus]